MDNELYLFLAFGITWVVFAVYLWSISKQAQNLSEEVRSIRSEDDPEQR